MRILTLLALILFTVACAGEPEVVYVVLTPTPVPTPTIPPTATSAPTPTHWAPTATPRPPASALECTGLKGWLRTIRDRDLPPEARMPAVYDMYVPGLRRTEAEMNRFIVECELDDYWLEQR